MSVRVGMGVGVIVARIVTGCCVMSLCCIHGLAPVCLLEEKVGGEEGVQARRVKGPVRQCRGQSCEGRNRKAPRGGCVERGASKCGVASSKVSYRGEKGLLWERNLSAASLFLCSSPLTSVQESQHIVSEAQGWAGPACLRFQTDLRALYTQLLMPYSAVSGVSSLDSCTACSQPADWEARSMLKRPAWACMGHALGLQVIPCADLSRAKFTLSSNSL